MSLWINIGFGKGDRPVSRKKFKALEKEMSVLSDKLATATAALAALSARVEEAVPTQADLDAVDAITNSANAILPAPVEPPAPEPTPEPTT
jgi:hypothetical protein